MDDPVAAVDTCNVERLRAASRAATNALVEEFRESTVEDRDAEVEAALDRGDIGAAAPRGTLVRI
jgi:hypothetical protein